MENVKSKVGKITFRIPNIAEGPEVLHQIGINSGEASAPDYISENILLIMSRLMQNMGKYIDKIELEGVKIKTYDELLNHKPARQLVYDMATRILDSLGDGEGKKGD